MNHRARLLALAATISLGVTALVAPTASAAPQAEGWRHGFCEKDEGLTVVVDFRGREGREYEARCRIGGDYPRSADPRADSRTEALEAVGYEPAGSGGLVDTIDGIDGGDDAYMWWMYSAVGPDAEGEPSGGWSSGSWSLPDGDLTNWFYGVCLSEDGCSPRIDPQYQPTARVAITGATRVTYGTAARVSVTVTSSAGSAPTGSVLLSGSGVRMTGSLVGGTASFTLPRTLAVGSYRLTAGYDGGTGFGAATSTVLPVTVVKGTTLRTTASWRTRPTAKRRGVLVVRSVAARGLATPSGKAEVRLRKAGKAKTVTVGLRAGTRAVKVPRLGRGTWRVRVVYRGDATYRAQSSPVYRVRIR